jgi:hypothetical protein
MQHAVSIQAGRPRRIGRYCVVDHNRHAWRLNYVQQLGSLSATRRRNAMNV